LLKLAAAVLTLLALSAAAKAAEVRYVASNGSNNNDCTLSAPCRTMQRGVNMTPAGGELIVLNSGDYGNTLTIGRSITISADGVTATLVDPGNISIDYASAVVVLRGLHLKGTDAPGVLAGILISDATAVHIEWCTIERFNNGIQLGGNDTKLFVTESVARSNDGTGIILSASGQIGRTLTIDNSRFENNGVSGVSISRAQATITRSVASGNGDAGVSVGGDAVVNITWTTASHNGDRGFALPAASGQMTLESSVARYNGTGLYVAGLARISRSVFTDNDIGIRVDSAGTLQRLQNSTLEGNGTDLSNDGTILAEAPF
jgi:nitrous oxidase accessory protein NosD